jgi:hypothetical protein
VLGQRKVLHEGRQTVKSNPVVILAVTLGVSVLAGCQHQPTLEEARALCTQQGGFLMVFYSQKVTPSGLGPQVATPGNCVASTKFDMAQPAPAPAAAGSPVSTASPAPASSKSPASAN